MGKRGDMRRETRDEPRQGTFRLLRLFVSRLTSSLSCLTSHVSCLWVIASILLVGLVWALFGQAGDFEYLNLDDPNYTFNCAFVRDGLSWANVREAFTNVRHEAIWMPVTNISYMCDISLFGPSAGAHHLVNVAIHALNAVLLLCLLFALGQRTLSVSAAKMAALPVNAAKMAAPPVNAALTGKAAFQAAKTGATGILPVAAAFLLTALWAVHPQRAEAVAWIASRKELLCTTFILGGLLFWLRARRREGWGWIPALVGTYACFILACMSKPTAMCFPFLVLSVECIMWPRQARPSPLSFVLCHLSFFLLLAAATGALAVYSQTHPEGYAELALYSAPLWWRILNALVAVGLYLFQMFIPVGIHLDYRAVPEGWPVHGALGLGVLMLVVLGGAGAWWWCRRFRRRAGQDSGSDRTTLFLVLSIGLWFFASLGPTLGIFGSFGDHARADRFLYLPAMAVPIAAMMLYGAAQVGEAASRRFKSDQVGEAASRRFKLAQVATLAIVVALFFTIAYPVVASYRTDMTAFKHTLAADPDNWRALAHIGQARCATGEPLRRMGKPEGDGELDAGIDMLRHSYTVKASDATAVKLVYALMCRGRSEDWDEILAVCAKFDPMRDLSGRALEALGTAELKKRRWREAIQHLWLSRNAPARNYARADAELKLAFALHNGGRREEARKWFEWFRDRSGRADLVRRARDALSALEHLPHGMLFW